MDSLVDALPLLALVWDQSLPDAGDDSQQAFTESVEITSCSSSQRWGTFPWCSPECCSNLTWRCTTRARKSMRPSTSPSSPFSIKPDYTEEVILPIRFIFISNFLSFNYEVYKATVKGRRRLVPDISCSYAGSRRSPPEKSYRPVIRNKLLIFD